MDFSVKAFLASVYLLAISSESQAKNNQLQCWRCSSKTNGNEDFCGTTFDESSVPIELLKESNFSAIETCDKSKLSEHARTVCRKVIEEDKGEIITRRFCYVTNKFDPLDLCTLVPKEENGVRRIFCEDCLTDKCNSATTQMSSAFLILLLPVLVAKMIAI